MAIELLTLSKDTVADATAGQPGGLLGYQTVSGVSTLREFPQPYPLTTTFIANVPFTGNANMGVKVVTTDIAFTVNTIGSVAFSEAIVCIEADGSHDVTWAATFNLRGEQTFDNTEGRLNFVSMWRDIDDRYYYSISLGPIV
jgi:hypothetical protein